MIDKLTVTYIDEKVAREILERNIKNSLRIIAGDFESALEDIIFQLEKPPVIEGRYLPSSDMTKRISRTLRQGFIGLPPNGFEFCIWLWEVAPIHYVQIPHANEIGMSYGFHYGVIHLRKIAAMVTELYTSHQPQRIRSILPLLDSSFGWVDARNLIIYTLLDYYCAHFEEEYRFLMQFVREKRIWRKLLPLGVAARIIVIDSENTELALQLIPPAFEAIAEKIVYDGISFALRSAALYGNHAVIAEFINSQRNQEHPEVIRVLCENIRLRRLHWSNDFRVSVLPILFHWRQTLHRANFECLDLAIAKLRFHEDSAGEPARVPVLDTL